MSVQEYKNKVVKDIEKLFKGIHFENIGIKDKKIIGMLTPEASEFFNSNGLYRKRTEELLKQISEYKTELLGTTLEFLSPNEEQAKLEVDSALKLFIEKIRLEIDIYTNDIIKLHFRKEKNEDSVKIDELPEVQEKNMINIGLSFIKIKIGEKEYSRVKSGREAESKEVTIKNLNLMIVYVYILIAYIEDKKNKYEEFVDFVATNFSVKDEEYLKARKLQTLFLNEKNYDTFIQKYNLVSEEVVWLAIEKEQEKQEIANTK